MIPLTLRWICPRLLVSDQSSCAFRHDELVSVLSSNQRHQRPYFNNLDFYTLNCPPPTVTVKKNESYTFGNSCVPLLNLHPTLHIDLHFTLVQRVLLLRTVVFLTLIRLRVLPQISWVCQQQKELDKFKTLWN